MDKFAPFKNRTEYQQALFRFNHPQHKEAMELRENSLHPKSDFKLITKDQQKQKIETEIQKMENFKKQKMPRGQRQKLLEEELKGDIEGVRDARKWRIETEYGVKLEIEL